MAERSERENISSLSQRVEALPQRREPEAGVALLTPVFAYWQINSCCLNFVIHLTGRPEAGERDYSFHVVKVKWLFDH